MTGARGVMSARGAGQSCRQKQVAHQRAAAGPGLAFPPSPWGPAFLEGAKAIEGVAGRPVTSPTLLLTLWVCGIREGIGSARELAKKCERDQAYRSLS